jgi:hypothetical protein
MQRSEWQQIIIPLILCEWMLFRIIQVQRQLSRLKHSWQRRRPWLRCTLRHNLVQRCPLSALLKRERERETVRVLLRDKEFCEHTCNGAACPHTGCICCGTVGLARNHASGKAQSFSLTSNDKISHEKQCEDFFDHHSHYSRNDATTTSAYSDVSEWIYPPWVYISAFIWLTKPVWN